MGSFRLSVEPLLLVMALSTKTYEVSLNEYIFQQLSKEYNLTTENKSLCSLGNGTEDLYNKVSSEASKWSMWTNVAGMMPFSINVMIKIVVTSLLY